MPEIALQKKMRWCIIRKLLFGAYCKWKIVPERKTSNMARTKRRKSERRKNRTTAFLCITAVVLAVCAVRMQIIRHTPSAEAGKVNSLAALEGAAEAATEAVTEPPAPVQDIPVHSKSALLLERKSGEEKYRKNAGERLAPASLTKIMTAVVVLDNSPGLEEKVTLSEELFEPLYKQNAALAGFEPGERVRVIDLLYGAMLPSGAEAAEALAAYISGSDRAFVEAMNQKAAELGMENTHFSNVTGLPDDNHYSTAEDLAKLLRHALENQTFRKIFTSERYSTASTNRHPDGITVRSSMFRSLPDASFSGVTILGGKTGYTDEAGLCLASLAKSGGTEYILITLGAEGDRSTAQYNIEDAKAIYTAYTGA